jgi:7-keto-8-aminopelargonate synthetase-like enzyme
MGETAQRLDFIDTTIRTTTEKALTRQRAEDTRLNGRLVTLRGEPRVNFASCSALGLELDPRLRAGAEDALARYGTQFSSSRTYLENPLYQDFEALLEEIVGGPVLVSPNTTLAHLTALPVVIGEDDAVILDHYVHHTVQLAVPQLRQQGSHVEFLRHGRMDLLEDRIRKLAPKHPKIWYLADGVYSMFGDLAPLDALAWLQLRYEQLHLYLDDAHGMSWTGRNGRGYVLDGLPKRERVLVAISLNKSFAAGGGAVVFPNAEMRRRVAYTGGPMTFTGPLQPPVLGAGIASAKIHLSPEMEGLQRELLERIRFANRRARELDLPLAATSEVPTRYLAVSRLPLAMELTRFLLDRGLLTNIAGFPAVPSNRSGVRFALTRHHTLTDIDSLLTLAADYLPGAMQRHGVARATIDRAFKLAPRAISRSVSRTTAPASGLTLQHLSSIAELDAREWDAWLGDRGSFDSRALHTLERVFGEHQKPENRWTFHYYVVRDAAGKPLLATFFTDALWKDDMLAPSAVSKAVEAQRAASPYHMTSRVFAMGCLITEGDHLFLDRSGDWRGALALLLSRVEDHAGDARLVVLRDLPADDAELEAELRELGWAATAAPTSLIVDRDWSSEAEFQERLPREARRFHRRFMAPLADAYQVEVFERGGRVPSAEELRHWYALYSAVHRSNLQLNTFALPEDLFARALEDEGWEVFTLRLRPERGGRPDSLPQVVGLSYHRDGIYVPLIVGLDYDFVKSHGAYRMWMHESLRRAEARGARRIYFGMGSPIEKARFGARPAARNLFLHSRDHFASDALSLIVHDTLQRQASEDE